MFLGGSDILRVYGVFTVRRKIFTDFRASRRGLTSSFEGCAWQGIFVDS